MKNNFIFLEVSTDYPISFNAGNTKMELMARGVIEAGGSVFTVNNWASTTQYHNDIKGVSNDGIPYVTFDSKVRFKTISNFKKTYRILKKNKKKDHNNAVILSTSRSYYMLLDIIAAKLNGYKTLFLFHEWRGALKIKSTFHRFDAWLKDHFIVRLFDAYLPISHYLLDKCNHISRRKKKLIVPILSDYSIKPKKHTIKERFSYCCGVLYMLRHPMLLDAMDKLVEKHSNAELLLILSGNDKDMENFKEQIKARKCANNITIRTKVPFDELKEIYSSSLALIIPLNPESVADIARFSQKIAEYIATGRPIITNNVGEIPYYFKNGESAYIADYSSDGFYKIMTEIIEDKEKANLIGETGFNVGTECFNYKKSSASLIEFINNI